MSRESVAAAIDRFGVPCLAVPDGALPELRTGIEALNRFIVQTRVFIATATQAEEHYREQAPRADAEDENEKRKYMEMEKRIARINIRPLPVIPTLPHLNPDGLRGYFDRAGARAFGMIQKCDDKIDVYREYIDTVHDFAYLHIYSETTSGEATKRAIGEGGHYDA